MKIFSRLALSLLLLGGCTTTYQVDVPVGQVIPPTPSATTTTPAGMPVVYVNGAGQHITHNDMWSQSGWPLGDGMRWEAIAQGDPWNPGGYLLADGYGGEHAILFSGSSGNIIFDQGLPTEQIISFSSIDLPPAGIFSHVSVAIQSDGYLRPRIVVRENGIPTANQPIPAGIHRTVAGSGSGSLFVGGSDHSNFVGWIAAVRGWDNVSPQDAAPTQAMIPERFFDGFGPSNEPVDFLVSYVSPVLETYPDLSSGYDSNGAQPRRITHPGKPYTGLDYGDFYWNPPVPAAQLPKVKYVVNAPFDAAYDQKATATQTALKRGCVKHTPPAGAKLFDSFCRADQEFFHTDVPDVGSIEYSSIGAVQRWKTGTPSGTPPSVPASGNGQKISVGLYNRSPIPLDYMGTAMWVNNNSANSTITSVRRPHIDTSSDGESGLVFRVQDESHMWAFFFQRVVDGEGNIVDQNFYLWRWDGYGYGTIVATGVGLTDDIANFTNLSVSTNGNNINCYADGKMVISIVDPTYNTATGVGMYLISALSRQYDWTVN